MKDLMELVAFLAVATGYFVAFMLTVLAAAFFAGAIQ